jgi:hypothetical protein
MFGATEVLSGSMAGLPLQLVALLISLSERGAKLEPHHPDGCSSHLGCGVVAGLVAKRKDSSSDLIVANGAVRSATSIFRGAAGSVLEFDLDIAAR